MREYNENDLIDSPLNERYTSGGKSVEIEIYRMPGTLWSIQVLDEFDNSTVWDEGFATDAEALAFVLAEIERDGIDEFIGSPKRA